MLGLGEFACWLTATSSTCFFFVEDRYGRAQGIKKKIILNLDLAKDRVSVLSMYG